MGFYCSYIYYYEETLVCSFVTTAAAAAAPLFLLKLNVLGGAESNVKGVSNAEVTAAPLGCCNEELFSLLLLLFDHDHFGSSDFFSASYGAFCYCCSA